MSRGWRPPDGGRRETLDAAFGVLAAVAIFVAVPGALAFALGLPPRVHWLHPSNLAGKDAFDALDGLAWIAWLGCCAPLLGSVVQRVRRYDTSPATGSPWVDRLAASMAAAVLMVLPMTATVAAAAAPSALAGRPAPTAAGVGPPVVSNVLPAGSPSIGVEHDTYVVQPDDSLWSIAQRLYGDGGDWEAIARLNVGRLMDDGTRFVDPSLISPGWRLALPSGAETAPLGTAALPAPPTPATTGAVQPQGIDPVAVALSRSNPPHPRVASAQADFAVGRTVPADTSPQRSGGFPLLDLTAGIGALGAAAVVRRVRRTRRLVQHSVGEGRSGQGRAFGGVDEDDATDDAAELEILFSRFEGTPALDWLELANRLLARVERSAQPVPGPLLFRVGPDGVDVWLSASTTLAPPLWERRSGGRVWHLSSQHDPAALAAECEGLRPAHPALVPIGDDAQGSWLAVVDPGCCLPVIGPDADAMVSTMRLAAASWPWSDQLTVSVDPDVVVHESQLAAATRADASGDRVGVLFVGDPARLTRSARQRCGVLTTLPLPATGITVAVDAQAATLHPLGITLRPHVLTPERRRAALELVLGGSPSPGATGSPEGTEASVRAASTPGPLDLSARTAPQMPTRPVPLSREQIASRAVSHSLEGGAVDVRLLVAVPRLEGLATELEPKRARRATELVAYLALHRPSPVTSDRLRTRVLGSPDADAAAKTLFNVATAARRAMGTGPAGELLLPPALKTGHYRISDLVTVDTERAAGLIAQATRADTPDEALALYRAALELVEDEPLSGVLSGYGWWQAEGHAGRIRALVVDAACSVARLASEADLDDLADWAIARARLLDPYSEALSRAAMRWAASSGNTDRLRREWVECQQRVDELDPGSVPSERTERLYTELTRRAT